MTAEQKTGDRMPDGSIYLGFHKDKHWFVTADDARPAPGKGLAMPFNRADQYAQDLHTHGHADWQLPDNNMLQEMFNLRSVGNFKGTYNETGHYLTGKYWSSTPDMSEDIGWVQDFETGFRNNHKKEDYAAVRCVRGCEDRSLTEARLETLKSRTPAKVTFKKP